MGVDCTNKLTLSLQGIYFGILHILANFGLVIVGFGWLSSSRPN